MNLEELKAKLDAKEITQEEYDQKVKELEGSKSFQLTDELKDFIAKQVQSETDKVRTKYTKELKDKDDKIQQLEEEMKKSLSAKDLAEYETKQEREKYEKEKAEFIEAKAKFEATQMLNKYGLMDDKLKYLNFVKADTTEEMELRCKVLRENINADVEKAVNERFKQNGRDIGGSGSSADKTTDVDFGKSLAQNRVEQTAASQKSTEYYFGK